MSFEGPIDNSPVDELLTDFDLLQIGPADAHLISDGSTPVWQIIAAVRQMVAFSKKGLMVVGGGTFRLYFPFAATFHSVRAALGVAPTGSAATFDVNKNTTTILTGGSIAVGDGANVSSKDTPAVTTIADGDYLLIDTVTVGSTTPGEDLTLLVEFSTT